MTTKTKKNRDQFFENLNEPLERILSYTTETLFPKGKERPFDSYHYWYYRDCESDGTLRTARDQMSWNHMHMQMARGGIDTIYAPCGITGGIRPHRLSVDTDYRVPTQIGEQTVFLRTTQDMNLSDAGSERLLRDGVEPNERDAMGRGQTHGRTLPDYNMLLPYSKEGAVRITRHDSDSSYGRPPEEWDFMGGWYTEIDEESCKGIIYERDIPFSRNSNWEMMRGIYNAIGMMNGVTRDNVDDFKIVKADGSYATISDIIQGNIEYLVYALENDFYAKEAATCLAWTLEIDKRLRDPVYNASTKTLIDAGQISGQLKEEYFSDTDWAVQARQKMDTLRPYAERLLKERFISHVPEEFMMPLESSYHDARDDMKPTDLQPIRGGEPAARPVEKTLDESLTDLGLDPNDPILKSIKKKIADLDGYLQSVHPLEKNEPVEALRKVVTPVFNDASQAAKYQTQMSLAPDQITHKTDVFDPEKFGARIFDRNYFDRIKSKKEQIAVRMAVGAFLSMQAAHNRGAWTFVSADFKKGDTGSATARNKGINNIQDLEESYTSHDGFVDNVVIPNIEQCQSVIEKEQARQKLEHGAASPVLSSINVDVMSAHAYKTLKDLTAVDGPEKLSSEAKMALRMFILDFMTDTHRLADREWAKSEKDVQHVVRSTLVQLGLVNRGNMHPANMVLRDHDGHELNLYERLVPICDHLKDCHEKGINAPDHAWAAAVLIQIHEMLHDPEYNKDRNGREIVDFNNLHPSFNDYRYQDQRDAIQKLIAGDQNAKSPIDQIGMRGFIFENYANQFSAEELADLDSDYRKFGQERTGEKSIETAPESPGFRMGVRGPAGP